MARVYRCDRCNTESPNNFLSILLPDPVDHGIGYECDYERLAILPQSQRHVDLCPECMNIIIAALQPLPTPSRR